MAAIFQIRRGTSDISSSIVDGELYLHKGKNSLQVAIGDGNPITLLALNTSSVGDINLTGSISASNMFVSGNLTVSGNLFLGNNQSDNISALGVFTTNLVPGTNNLYDVGTPTAIWKTMYANTFSGSFEGSILGLGNPTQFSASVDNRLDQLETFSGSQEAKNIIISAYSASMNSFTSSVNGHIVDINIKTGSFENKFVTLQTYTASVDVHISNVNSFTSSQEAKDVSIGAYTSSMNLYTSSVNGHISDINTYTASLKNAIDVTGGNTRILGNLIVDGTQTSLNTTETFVEDKSITLASGSTTSAIADGAGLNIAGANVSMSWEDSNQRLYFNTTIAALGSISSSTVVGLNGDSVTVYSTSVDSRLSNLQSKSASVDNSILLLGQYTQSQDNKNTTLATYTASVDSDLASIHQTTSSLNQFTASISGINEFTASTKIRLDNLENTSASFSSSIGQLNSVTASLYSYTSSANAWSGGIDNKLIGLETISASHSSSINQINSVTASLMSWTGSGFFNAYSSSVDSLLDGLRYDVDLLTPAGLSAAFDNLNSFTSSANSRLNSIEAATSSYETTGRGIVSGSSQVTPLLPTGTVSGSSQVIGILTSLNTFTASNDNTSLNLYTSSLKGAITISGTDVSIAGGLTVLGTTTIIDSTTLNIKDNIIQLNGAGSANAGLVVRDATGTTTSGSLLWDTTNDYWIAGPLGAESKLLRENGDNVVSSSSQVSYVGLSNIPSGIISSSTQIDTLFNIDGLVSGSSQIDATATTNFATGVKTQLNSNTVVSGSSQITAGSTTNFGTDVKAQLNSNTVVSGSSQITLSSTTGGDTSANVQFGSLGIGTTASGVSGEIRATGDITAFYSSDIRLKENIQPIQNALEKVESISGNTYDWKEGYEELHSHKGNDVGVIAQEIEEILPQIVTNRDNGFKAVQYEKIIPLLIEAIKELSDKVKVLENK